MTDQDFASFITASSTTSPSESDLPSRATKRITSSTAPNSLASTPEPRLSAPRLEPSPQTTSSEPIVSSAPKYNPYREEALPTALPRNRVPVQVSSGFATTPSFSGDLESNGMPNIGFANRAQPAPARVAPAPTALVRRTAVSARVPKPLVDTAKETAPPVANVLMDSAGDTAPADTSLVSADGGRNESRCQRRDQRVRSPAEPWFESDSETRTSLSRAAGSAGGEVCEARATNTVRGFVRTLEVSDLERDLETDLALSERQVVRHYGLTLEACRESGLIVQSVFVAPTVHRKATREVNFVLLELRDFAPFELRHLAGIAETRHRLQADPRDWQVIQHAAQTSPDASWQRGNETWAVEFDAGAYSRTTVLEKAQAFQAGFDGQIWACSSNTRQNTLQGWLEQTPLLVQPY